MDKISNILTFEKRRRKKKTKYRSFKIFDLESQIPRVLQTWSTGPRGAGGEGKYLRSITTKNTYIVFFAPSLSHVVGSFVLQLDVWMFGVCSVAGVRSDGLVHLSQVGLVQQCQVGCLSPSVSGRMDLVRQRQVGWFGPIVGRMVWSNSVRLDGLVQLWVG